MFHRIVQTTCSTGLMFFLVTCVFAGEHAKPVFDDRIWELGWSQNQNDSVFEEYVLQGEKVESWSELVTIQFFPGLNTQVNPDVLEAQLKLDLTRVCPDVHWESLEQSDDERVWKWNVISCPGQPDQSEIARLKRTDQGYHIWHYAIKQAPIPVDKEETWMKNIKGIVVEP